MLMFIFSGLALLRVTNNKKVTRIKLAGDTLITFAGGFFTEEIESQSHYNAVQIEVSFVSTERDSDKYLAHFWLFHVNIAWP